MSGEKTEKATPKRRKDLRKKGVMARSAELPAGISLVVLVVMLPFTLRELFMATQTGMMSALSNSGTSDVKQASSILKNTTMNSLRAIVMLLLVAGVSGVLGTIIVGRQRPSLHGVTPRFTRLNPKGAIKRIFSMQAIFDLLKISAKLSLITLALWGGIVAALQAAQAGPLSYGTFLTEVGSSAKRMLLMVAGLAAVVGLVDAAYSRRRYNKQARMSKQDIKDEHNQTEGNPLIRSFIRSRQLRMARRRMIEAVPKADVILANPTHLVVALKYDETTAAPKVVAKGAGVIATRIKEVGAEHGVPIVENKPLARAIYKAVEIGDIIPGEFYEAVARVLAVVYAARRRRRIA